MTSIPDNDTGAASIIGPALSFPVTDDMISEGVSALAQTFDLESITRQRAEIVVRRIYSRMHVLVPDENRKRRERKIYEKGVSDGRKSVWDELHGNGVQMMGLSAALTMAGDTLNGMTTEKIATALYCSNIVGKPRSKERRAFCERLRQAGYKQEYKRVKGRGLYIWRYDDSDMAPV